MTIKALPAKRSAASLPLFFQRFGIQGHEGDAEGSLRRDPPEEVRELEGDEECVRHRSGTQDGRGHHIPDEAGDAGQTGHARDRGHGFYQIHMLTPKNHRRG
jgi:hypothetical protein